MYAPDRLKYPLLRKGERGEGKWQRIPWNEAIDMMAEKMQDIRQKYTPCGHLFTAGSDLQSTFVGRFAEVYGSYNVTSHESLCLLSGSRAFLDTFGEVPFADVLNSKYIIMAGANRFEALVTPDSIDLMTAMQKGAKLVVLDPRYTKTAALADEWYPIQPGTDMVFMLALAHVIINEELYDKKWIAEKTYGIDQLREHVQKYDPRFAAEECGIPAQDIALIARDLAAAAPASMIYPGRRTSDYKNSTQVRRSFAIVNGLLGNWDQPGGLLAAREVGLKGVPYDAPWYDDNPDDRIDAHKVPMLFEHDGSFVITRDAVLEGKPYPIKGWFVYKTNPMGTAPNRAKTIEMCKSMEFMTVVDIAMSDTAWMADLVLPAPSYLELGEYFDFTIEEYRKQQLRELPGAAEAFKKDGVYYNPSKVYGIYEDRVYKTLSKKVELYNQRYEKMGVDPLPVYTPPSKPPKNRFRMVIGRSASVTQTSSQNNSVLHQITGPNTLWLNTKAAERLGITPGDTVEVSSAVGKGALKVEITDGIREDTVYMLSGFGALSPQLSLIYGEGASMAAVLEEGYDEICGNAAMHETFVSVTRKVAS